MFFRRFRTFTKRLNGLVKRIAELCSLDEIVVSDVRPTWPNFVAKEKAEAQSLRQPVTSYASNLYFFYCSLPPWNLEPRIFAGRTWQMPGR